MVYTGIVLAAGKGRRMKSDVSKQFMELNGKPVIYYALAAFEKSRVDQIILVTGESDIDYCRKEIVDKYGLGKVCRIVAGGEERYDSVWRGLYLKDMNVAILKAIVFGFTIALVSCTCGYKATGGAKGVGLATTKAVVWSFIAIVILDMVFAVLFFF